MVRIYCNYEPSESNFEPLFGGDIWRILQEEAEAGYKEQFPDHFAMYADIGDDVLEGMEPNPGQLPEASRAEASSAVAQELVHGDLLTEVVHLHARSAAKHYLFTSGPFVPVIKACNISFFKALQRNIYCHGVFHTAEFAEKKHCCRMYAPAGNDQTDWRQAFLAAYDLGARLARGCCAQGLAADIDEQLGGANLLRVCLEQAEICGAPAAKGGHLKEYENVVVAHGV